ncbi:hypothetical protein [Clostridium magnum]|uniref:Chromosome partition protein Smc n=1 Tax=Clostridium magnum DSM 2767 TaxID=1121326 RepID=A0A161XGW1_9CLOT|nr:hypothetical protein [Clostridium magnum]KZL93866.1 hypothetical protein CLMAG_09190 [Clostridium magnum DSM 2767]SHH97474.1 hypothetical protein SAMN02745944_01940 [Clostridium magnum DSM 2767]
MASMPSYSQRVSMELKQDLTNLQKKYGGQPNDFLQHLVDLYKRELNGEFNNITLNEAALTASKQLTEISTSAHDLYMQLVRNSDINLELTELRGKLSKAEARVQDLEQKLVDKDSIIASIKKEHTEKHDQVCKEFAQALDNLEDAYKKAVEASVLPDENSIFGFFKRKHKKETANNPG